MKQLSWGGFEKEETIFAYHQVQLVHYSCVISLVQSSGVNPLFSFCRFTMEANFLSWTTTTPDSDLKPNKAGDWEQATEATLQVYVTAGLKWKNNNLLRHPLRPPV